MLDVVSQKGSYQTDSYIPVYISLHARRVCAMGQYNIFPCYGGCLKCAVFLSCTYVCVHLNKLIHNNTWLLHYAFKFHTVLF